MSQNRNKPDPSRPAHPAFKPAVKADLQADLILAAVCLAGCRHNGDFSAYQQIDARVYKRLEVGQILPVDYLPADPNVSCLDLTPSQLKKSGKQAGAGG